MFLVLLIAIGSLPVCTEYIYRFAVDKPLIGLSKVVLLLLIYFLPSLNTWTTASNEEVHRTTMSTPNERNVQGQRLIQDIIDSRAQSSWPIPWALIPLTVEPAAGFREVSFRLLANAINRTAWWLDSKMERLVGNDEVLAYLGPNDLRYAILVLACAKTKRVVWYLRPLTLTLFDRTSGPPTLHTKPACSSEGSVWACWL